MLVSSLLKKQLKGSRYLVLEKIRIKSRVSKTKIKDSESLSSPSQI